MTDRLTDAELKAIRDGYGHMMQWLHDHGNDQSINAINVARALANEAWESRAALATKAAEAERAWRAIPARFALCPSDGGGIDTHHAIEDMAAEIERLTRELHSASLDALTAHGQAADNHARAIAAEAQVKALREVLERIKHETIIRQPATAVQTVKDVRAIADTALGEKP